MISTYNREFLISTYNREFFKNLEDVIKTARIHKGQKRFYWTLPRMSGVTTYFIERIEKDLVQGKTICFAGLEHIRSTINNNSILREALKRKDLIVITEYSKFNSLRGRRIDIIYADCIKEWSVPNQMEFVATTAPCLGEDGYAVFINTTDGEP